MVTSPRFSQRKDSSRASRYQDIIGTIARCALSLKKMAGATHVDEYDIYSQIGEEGFARLVGAFYKQIPGDSVLGPMYAGRDMGEAEQRLRDFLIFRFGGPSRYLDQRGHPRL